MLWVGGRVNVDFKPYLGSNLMCFSISPYAVPVVKGGAEMGESPLMQEHPELV